jgi:hypothetical protein
MVIYLGFYLIQEAMRQSASLSERQQSALAHADEAALVQPPYAPGFAESLAYRFADIKTEDVSRWDRLRLPVLCA